MPLLPAAILLVTFGFVVMSLELLSSNMMAPYFGSSIYVWGSVISTFMIHMSLGYVLGGYLSKRLGKLWPLLIILIGGCLYAIMIPWIIRPVGAFMSDLISDERLGSLATMSILFFPPVITMAMVSPWIIGLMARTRTISGLSGGVVMFLSTLGSFLGTILTSFFFIDWAPISRIVRVEGGVALLVCVVILVLRPDRFIKNG